MTIPFLVCMAELEDFIAIGNLWPLVEKSDHSVSLCEGQGQQWPNCRSSQRYFFVFKQFCNIYTQSYREPLQPINRDIGDAAFKLRHVGSMEIRQFSHPLLA